MSGDDERALVAAFLGGDEAAFRALYARHSPAVYGVLARMLGAPDAQDALQETWLRAARGIGSFRWQGALRSWLTGIAINCARELLRARGPLAPAPAVEPAAASAVATSIDLERAVLGLAEGYRLVLLLHDAQGYTHAEIGRMLGIEEGTSKSQLSRARRALRTALHAPPLRRTNDGG